MKVTCCKDCTERHALCQDTCPKLKAQKDEIARIKRLRTLEGLADCVRRTCITRHERHKEYVRQGRHKND